MIRTSLITILVSAILMISFVWLAVPVCAEEAVFGGIGLQVVPTVDGDLVVDGGIRYGDPSTVISLIDDRIEVLREGCGDISWIE